MGLNTMAALQTTLCYISRGDETLMLYRNKKKHDPNAGKWVGVGGRFEFGESPEECMLREVREETRLTLSSWAYRGLVTFVSGEWCEYMHLFTACAAPGEAVFCDEGTYKWIKTEAIAELPAWEGDRIFLRLLQERTPFFSLKLVYAADGHLASAFLDGTALLLRERP